MHSFLFGDFRLPAVILVRFAAAAVGLILTNLLLGRNFRCRRGSESGDVSTDSPGSGFTGLTTRREVFWIAVSGAATGACWLCYYYAVKYGPLSVVVPVNKMSVPIAVIYSHFVFGERMQPRERTGMAGIVCGMMAVAVLG